MGSPGWRRHLEWRLLLRVADHRLDQTGIEKGLLVGDAATRIKQTLMFDLPVVTKSEVQDLLNKMCSAAANVSPDERF